MDDMTPSEMAPAESIAASLAEIEEREARACAPGEPINPTIARLLDVIRELVAAMQQECEGFSFPDEDRPIIYQALTLAAEKLGEGR